MKQTSKIIVLLLALSGCLNSMQAADADSIVSVPDHLMMRIYRGLPSDDFRHGLLKNWEFGAYWAPEALWSRAQYQASGFGLGAYLAKDITPAHTLRASFSFAMPTYDTPAYGSSQNFYMRRTAVDLGLLWNLSHYYGGYDLSRRGQLLLSLGATAAFTQAGEQVTAGPTGGRHDEHSLGADEGTATSVGGWLGLQWRRVLSPRLAIYAEPQLRIMGDNYDAGTNDAHYDAGVSALVGAAYRLSPSYWRVGDDDESRQKAGAGDNWFVQLQGGWITSAGAEGIPAGYTPNEGSRGINIGFGVGRWLGQGYGARFSMFESTYRYAIDPSGLDRYTQLHGGRAEILIDPFRLFTPRPVTGRLGLDLSLGAEVGEIKKHKDGITGYTPTVDAEGNPIAGGGQPIVGPHYSGRGYFGLTAGGQVKYFVNRHSAFFVEGRFSNPRYQYENQTLDDKVVALDFGLEVYNTNFDRYVSERRAPRRIGQDLRETWFTEFGFGLSHAVHAGENFDNLTDRRVSIGVGRRMDPYSSVRARLEATLLQGGQIGANKPAEANAALSLDYLMTLTNAWMGIDPQRHVDLRLLVGQLLLLEGLTDFDMGYELGIQASHRFSPGWEIFFEPRYQALYSAPSRWDLGGGATYTFVKRTRKQRLDLSRWFVQMLTGAELLSVDLQGRQVNRDFHKIGSVDLAVGRQMDPIWSLRAGIFASEIEAQHVMDPMAGLVPQTSQYVGGRLEAQFNLLRSFSRKLEDSRWNIAMMAGAEGGHVTNAWQMDEQGQHVGDHRYSFGFTMAGQLQYRLTRYGWLVGQLRAQQLNLDHSHLLVNAHAGVQYDLYNRKRIDMKKAHNRWYFGGGVGWMNGHIGTVDVFAGDNFTPVHGVRLGLTFADSPLRNLKFDLHHWPSVRGEYLLNLSNLAFGVDDERYIDFSALAGLELTYHSLREVAREGTMSGMNWHTGIDWGLHVATHLTRGVSFYVEPRFSYMPTDNLTTLEHERVNLFTTAGLRLDMNPYGKGRRWMERDDRNYIQLKLVLQPWNVYDRGLKGADAVGVGGELTYGHWFNDIWGAQVSGYVDNYAMFGLKQKAAGGRAEVAVDLTSAMNPDWRRKPFMLVGTVGLNAGTFEAQWHYSDFLNYYEYNESHNADYVRMAAADAGAVHTSPSQFRLSPTMAMELRYRPGKAPISLSLGARFTEYNYQVPVEVVTPAATGTAPATPSLEEDRHFFMPVSTSLGLMYNF